jgi:hypothetical protein
LLSHLLAYLVPEAIARFVEPDHGALRVLILDEPGGLANRLLACRTVFARALPELDRLPRQIAE